MTEETMWDELASLPAGKFKSGPHYDPDSDTLETFINDEPSFRDRVDSRITVYISMLTKEIVGYQIKNASKIIDVKCKVL